MSRSVMPSRNEVWEEAMTERVVLVPVTGELVDDAPHGPVLAFSMAHEAWGDGPCDFVVCAVPKGRGQHLELRLPSPTPSDSATS